MAPDSANGWKDRLEVRLNISFQVSGPFVRLTWLTRNDPSSSWLGTPSLNQPCIALMEEKGAPESSMARVNISEEAYWTALPRIVVAWATAASPWIHQSGSDNPTAATSPASPKKMEATLPKPCLILAIWTRWRASVTVSVVIQSLVPQKSCCGIMLNVDRWGNSGAEPMSRRVMFSFAKMTTVWRGREAPSELASGVYIVSSALAARWPSASMRCGKTTSKCCVRIVCHCWSGGY